MPIPIKAYACQFRCGIRSHEVKEAVEKHEKICYSNPERRACKSCKSREKDLDGLFCLKGILDNGDYAICDCEYYEVK